MCTCSGCLSAVQWPMWHCKMVFVLLLANGAEGRPFLLLTNRATVGLIPFRNGRNLAGLSKHEAPPPSRPLVGRVASTGSLSAAVVFFTKRLGLAATKAAPSPVAPAAGFWSTVGGLVGGVVPLSVVLAVFALGWKITSAENTALITSLDTARQRELTKMDTERKRELTRMDTERKMEQTRMDTERKVEQTRMDTERKADMAALKAEQTRMDTERKAEQTRMLTELKDTLASNVAELKTANRAEVEKLVADQRLVSVDDQAQVAKDIEAAVDRLNATTIHATWDEKAEEGTVQATLGKRPFMIAPSSTIDSRSDLAFHLRANGEALQLSVVSESGTKLLATRDLSHVFKGCKVKRFQVLRLPPHPSLLAYVTPIHPLCLRAHSTSHSTSRSPAQVPIASSQHDEEADTWAVFPAPGPGD